MAVEFTYLYSRVISVNGCSVTIDFPFPTLSSIEPGRRRQLEAIQWAVDYYATCTAYAKAAKYYFGSRS